MPPPADAATEILARHATPQARERDPERPLWWAAYTGAWLLVGVLAVLFLIVLRFLFILG